MGWYTPSIKVRKLQSGHPCPGCSLLMHHGDMIAYASPTGRTVYLHDKCAEILLTAPEEDVILEENTVAAGEQDG